METQNYLEKVSFKINNENKIVEISDDWIHAATVGKAPELMKPEKVVGKPLLDFVMGDATRMHYEIIFKKCRLLKNDHEIKYRCDSPTHKRFMKMLIQNNQEDSLFIDNYLLKEEPFENPIHVIENVRYQRKNPVQRCSICNSLKPDKNKGWVAPETLSQFKERTFIVIHTVCESCKKASSKRR